MSCLAVLVLFPLLGALVVSFASGQKSYAFIVRTCSLVVILHSVIVAIEY